MLLLLDILIKKCLFSNSRLFGCIKNKEVNIDKKLNDKQKVVPNNKMISKYIFKICLTKALGFFVIKKKF